MNKDVKSSKLSLSKLPLLVSLLLFFVIFASASAQSIPQLPPDPPGEPGQPVLADEYQGISDAMIVDLYSGEPEPARQSNRENLIFGSGTQMRIYLPIVQMNDSTTMDIHPAVTAAVSDSQIGSLACPGAPPWISRHRMTAATFEQSLEDYWDNMGFRPISVSANGSGANARFSAVWVQDNVLNWRIHYDMTGSVYNQIVRDYSHEGYRPVAVDAYGSGSGLRYTAIWVKDAHPFGGRHGISEGEMNSELESVEAAGYRPVWVSGHESAGGPHFAGLWVYDGLSGTARIGLTMSELTGDIGQAMTDAGFRILQISGYLVDDEDDPQRFAVSWVKDPAECGYVRWEAFPEHTSTQYQIKASSQISLGEMKVVAGNAISLSPSDMGGQFRIAQLPLRHFLGSGGIAELYMINETSVGQVFQHGDILVLRLADDDRVLVRERSYGNIRLRPWDADDPSISEECESGQVTCPDIEGQPFFLDDRQYRLLLQYDSNDQMWYELQRNGVSPDTYWPLALDEYGPPDSPVFASVWVAGNTTRTWRVTGPGVNDPEDPFVELDEAMRAFMEARRVPGGTLAIVKDGRLVLSRGYTWDVPEAQDINPQRRFRLASLAKSLTSVAIMQLVESGAIGLNQKVVDIPGMHAILNPDQWIDQRIKDVTVRHLLHHLGGWDRAVSTDPMLNDYEVCSQTSNTLPTTYQAIIDHMKDKMFNHDPGTVYAYSNFGYTLLGRIIEVVSGQTYASYMQDNVFSVAGMQHTQLARNTDVYLDFREVRYYQPMNHTVSSRLGFNDDHPLREICKSGHADRVPNAYGGANLSPMDAHGGWSSTAVDLARFLTTIDSQALISNGARAQMWQRPHERTRRVYFFDDSGGMVQDYTWHARGNSEFSLMSGTSDLLLVGKGLSKFSTIDIELSQPGQNYTLNALYFNGVSLVPLTEDDHNFQDETENFTVSGSEVTITFAAPEDWSPIALTSAGDTQPRYWILLRTTTTPVGPPAVVKKVFPSGEADYALGWTTGHSQNVPYWLPYTPFSEIYPGDTVIGQQSKASGVVDLVYHEPGGKSWLRLLNVEGGPFIAEELLTVPADPRGQVLYSELAPNVVASHNGLLFGTITEFKHRRDGIHYVVLFNHNRAGAFYIMNDNASQVRLDNLIDKIASDEWPDHDLFELYP
jgi:CubicO group peptidase (beta-lactamase class C family)